MIGGWDRRPITLRWIRSRLPPQPARGLSRPCRDVEDEFPNRVRACRRLRRRHSRIDAVKNAQHRQPVPRVPGERALTSARSLCVSGARGAGIDSSITSVPLSNVIALLEDLIQMALKVPNIVERNIRQAGRRLIANPTWCVAALRAQN